MAMTERAQTMFSVRAPGADGVHHRRGAQLIEHVFDICHQGCDISTRAARP